MIQGKKVVVVMPAYNAQKTLEQTYREIPLNVVDLVILVDDASQDKTVEVAERIGVPVIVRHKENRGYGANQKTCYQEALKHGSDIVIMLHPDYQYTPALIEPLAWLIAHETYDFAIGSRLLGNSTLRGGMPLYKFFANRALTALENLILWQHISEYHSGYRAFSRRVLETIPFQNNSDGFVFDNEILAQTFYAGFRVGEISCPTKYFPEASSINFRDSVRYGWGCLRTMIRYRLQCWHIASTKNYEGLKRNQFAGKVVRPSSTANAVW